MSIRYPLRLRLRPALPLAGALLSVLPPAPGIPLGAPTAGAQERPELRFERAHYAWDGGRYLEALRELEGLLLPGAVSQELLERIALLTGELYRVAEVAPDGRAVRWSSDGRWLVFETGAGPELRTHLFQRVGGEVRRVGEAEGSGLVFAPGGERAAYLRLEDSEGLRAARREAAARAAPGDRAAQMRLRGELARIDAEHTALVVRDLASGSEEKWPTGGLAVREALFGTTGEELYFVGNEAGDTLATDLYRAAPGAGPRRITRGEGRKDRPRLLLGGSHLGYRLPGDSLEMVEVATGHTLRLPAGFSAFSPDGGVLAFLERREGETVLATLSLAEAAATGRLELRVAARTALPVAATTFRACPACPELSSLALSHDGSRLAFQAMPREDWEIFLADSGGAGEPRRFTREIQHDLFPTFLPGGRLLALKGESRHRRAHLYDLETGESVWLFHNNTVRTVAPEYEWALSPGGDALLFVADRDGNTISPERGVYLMDLTRMVTREELLERVRGSLAAEAELREGGRRMFEAIAPEVRKVTQEVSTARVSEYGRELYRFDSKYITEPGNALAIGYLVRTLRSWGYEPELQWFEPRGVRTANVIAVLEGTTSPEVLYAVSSHFDSSLRGPGADDNSSGTAALLEVARVLAERPLPATVHLAFFTGEEAGLLGSREYVRRAVESGDNLVGALNNDMVGWAESHRLDNTIRYSNDGIRELQHAAAIHFSDLITYDARYYRSTDAHAYVEAFGDIVGGIGSYPILASPHYHQVHDVLETVNHQLVAEVARVTAASIMLMASSPSPLKELRAEVRGSGVAVEWAPAPEGDVTHYRVAFGPQDDPFRTTLTVREPRVLLEGAGAGTFVSAKGVNHRGMEGWDWARVVVGR